MSMERFSTSPFRKSACVADWKNLGDEASSPRAQPRDRAMTVATRRAKGRMRATSVLRDGDGERAGAVDGVVGGDFPFAERRTVHRIEVAAVAIAFEDAEHRRRERGQQFAVDHRARLPNRRGRSISICAFSATLAPV